MLYVVNMETKTYLISELEQLTGLPRRTIHFYVQKGLVPAPSSKGGPARYPEESLLRLQMIRLLQGSHLKLDGIREALDGMDASQMRQMVTQAESGHKEWDVETLKKWVNSEPVSKPKAVAGNISFASIGNIEPVKENHNLLSSIKRQPAKSAVKWERHCIEDGIELNIREDLSFRAQQLVQALLRELKR